MESKCGWCVSRDSREAPVAARLAAWGAVAVFATLHGASLAHAQLQPAPAGSAVSGVMYLPGDLERPVSAIENAAGLFSSAGFQVADSYLLRRSDGSWEAFGAPLGAACRPPTGAFVQASACGIFTAYRRADGSVLTNRPPGVAIPADAWSDISAHALGGAGVTMNGQVRAWGSNAGHVASMTGKFADVEASNSAVVARTAAGTLVAGGLFPFAIPSGAFVEHRLALLGGPNQAGYPTCIARRADGTIELIGQNSAPASFRSRAYTRVRTSWAGFFGGVDLVGDAWIGGGSVDRRIEGPFVDIALGGRSLLGLRADGRVVVELKGTGAALSMLENAADSPTGPRFALDELRRPIALFTLGGQYVPAEFGHFADGTVRLIGGGSTPSLTGVMGPDGVIARDVVACSPILARDRAGALIMRLRDGTLRSIVMSEQPGALPYRVPSGRFREFVGESLINGVRRLHAIDEAGGLVAWDPASMNPVLSVVIPNCESASGQFMRDWLSSAPFAVSATAANGVRSCIGSATDGVCSVPADVTGPVRLTRRNGFGTRANGSVARWGFTAGLVPAPPVEPFVEFGVDDFNPSEMVNPWFVGRRANGQVWVGAEPTVQPPPYTLNDPAFTANDVVQVMSQCTVRVGAHDCDGDGVLDWDEIVGAGAAGDCNDNGVPDECDIAAGAPDGNANGIIDSCEPPPPGDLDGDGLVNAQDLEILVSAWGSPAPGAADLNGDGVVSSIDLAVLLASWSR